MAQNRGNVTVVVCEFEGHENRKVIVIEYHIDEKEAKRLAKEEIRLGWITNHNLPYDVAHVIAEAYSYDVHHASVKTPLTPPTL